MNDINVNTQIRLEEYKALNAETLQRIQMGERTINLLFVAAAAVWAIGTQGSDTQLGDSSGQGTLVFLLYPWLAFFLAAGWASNAVVLADVGVYTRNYLERKIEPLHWATHFSKRIHLGKSFTNLFVMGTFVGSQVISILLFFQVRDDNATPFNCPWLFGSFVAVVLTVMFLAAAMRYMPEHDNPHKKGLTAWILMSAYRFVRGDTRVHDCSGERRRGVSQVSGSVKL